MYVVLLSLYDTVIVVDYTRVHNYQLNEKHIHLGNISSKDGVFFVDEDDAEGLI